jgi:hypothetical protein
MYEVRCIFCRETHRSEFFDEIEEQILACRDAAPEWKRGSLQSYKDPGMKPISTETAVYAEVSV